MRLAEQREGRSVLPIGVRAALCAALSLLGASARAQGIYSVSDLGTLGGQASSAWGINALGAVVGQATDGLGRTRPFYWSSGGGMIDLGTLGGASGAAYGLADTGMVVGFARGTGNLDLAFVWDSAGGIRPVPGLGTTRPSYAYSINSAGRIVGSLFNAAGIEHSFVFDPSLGLVDPFGGSPDPSGARAVNAAGQVFGFRSTGSNGGFQGFRWEPSASPSMFGPSFSTYAYGGNDAGLAVGEQSGVGAFRWNPGASGPYSILAAGAIHPDRANAINAAGLIVGYGTDATNHRHGFVYSTATGALDLNLLLRPGSGLVITEARGINASGQIAAVGTNGAGQTRAVLLTPPPAQAILYVRADAAAGGDGLSWATAYQSLQDALDASYLSAGTVQQIWVARGTYRPSRPTATLDPRSPTFLLGPGVSVFGGFAGNETVLSQRDWQSNTTVLSGDLAGNDGPNFANISENARHVVTIFLEDAAAATLDGFTISGGNADGSASSFGDRGAGLLCQRGSPVFRNLTFADNSALSLGGGACTEGSRPAFEACEFVHNRSFGSAAGLQANLTAVVDRCTFRNNFSSSGSGPGGLSASGHTVVRRSVFAGNSGGSGGGAVLDSQATMINCLVIGNSARDFGGGVECSAGTSIINCLIDGNTAQYGGGVAGGGQIASCTIVQNRAVTIAGGLYAFSGDTPFVTNSILWANTDPGEPRETAQVAASAIINYSCVQHWTGTLGGAGNIGADPRFIDIDGPDNIPGTPDDDLHLTRPASPCIDAGSTSSLPPDDTDLDADGDTVEFVPLGLDMTPRMVDDPLVPDTGEPLSPVTDMGAYEVQAPPCYANCDGSTVPPILNVNDFSCFLNKYAQNDPYANCDGSTVPPILNVNDFQCFVNAFALGCH